MHRENGILPGRAARMVMRAFLAVVCVYAFGTLIAGWVPYEWIAKTAAHFSLASAQPMSASTYGEVVVRLRWLSAVLVLLWIGLFFIRDRLEAIAEDAYRTYRLLVESRHPSLVAWAGSYVRREPLTVACFLVIVGIGIALRLAFLHQPMRLDESWTYLSFVRMPVLLIPIKYNAPNNQILNTLLIKLSVTLFGNSPEAIRLPAFLFGFGLIPLCYGFVRSWIGPGAAIIGAALVATSSPLIEYSTNGRGYTALCFFLVAILWAGRSAIATKRRGAWAIVVACAALGTYTIPIMLIPAATAFLWFYFLMVRAQHRLWGPDFGILVRTMIALAIAVAVLYVPVFVINGHRGVADAVHYHNAASVQLERLPEFAKQIGSIWSRDYPPYLAWCLLVLAMGSPLIAYRCRDQLVFLAAATATSLVLYLLVVSDLGYPRVWLFVLPLFLIMAASGVEGLLQRGAAVVYPGHPRFLEIVYVFIAVGLSLWVGRTVMRNKSVLTSQETGVFLGAQAAAHALLAASANDMVAVDLLQTAPLVYYAQRLGTPLSATGTVSDIHYFTVDAQLGDVSSVHEPTRRRLFMVVDKDCCSIDSLVSRTVGVVPAPGRSKLVSEDAHMAVYEAEISSSFRLAQ